MLVSIPYEREGIFRLGAEKINDAAPMARFNSLRTGRYLQTKPISPTHPPHPRGFQFPTNGKVSSDCRNQLLWSGRPDRVSIPYEREGIFRRAIYLLPNDAHVIVSIPYEREGIFRLPTRGVWSTRRIVSIPYEREGIFRLRRADSPFLIKEIQFQFPTNGKVSSDNTQTPPANNGGTVSIPYEREGIFRHLEILTLLKGEKVGFNSLRTGRYLQTIGVSEVPSDMMGGGFNSLRTGRYLQTYCLPRWLRQRIPVSIPYEREGIFRHLNKDDLVVASLVFQFPTNGKVSSDSKPVRWKRTRGSCFNSLRTGRYLQTYILEFCYAILF